MRAHTFGYELPDKTLERATPTNPKRQRGKEVPSLTLRVGGGFVPLLYAAVGLALAATGGLLRGDPGKDAVAERVARLIRQLGDDDYDKREAASKELEAIGEPALGAVRKALAHKDLEVRFRAFRLVEAIEDALPFFNGKDLTGWQGLGEHWSVADGDLVGDTGPDGLTFNTFLCSRKKYRDFELSFQVRLTGKDWPGNSGVQIRSEVVDPEKFVVKGPQCDIGAGYWGDLHGELFGGLMKQAPRKETDKVVKENAFNDYFIRCVGKRVTIKVNGLTTVDAEFDRLPDEGIIAWQLHGGKSMSVTIRNIAFKELGGQ